MALPTPETAPSTISGSAVTPDVPVVAPTAVVPTPAAAPGSDKGIPALAGEMWTLGLAYAKQETVDPLKALGQWFKLGLPGAILAALGIGISLLGLLRLLQTELLDEHPRLTFLGYLAVVVVAVVVIVLAVKRIKPKDPAGAGADSKGATS